MALSVLVLKIDVPNTLIHHSLFDWGGLPCVCKVAGGVFLMSFHEPLPTMEGVVEGWSLDELNLRVPSYTGGKVSFHFHATVSLNRIAEGEFSISQLSSFVPSFPGWCPIIANGAWSDPVCRNTPEELRMIAEIEAECDAREAKRKKREMLKKRYSSPP